MDRTYLIAEAGLYMATRGGARAVGLGDRIGSLEPGKRADVVHTLDRPEMVPTTNMIRNLFYTSRSKSVHAVVIDGKVILEDGASPASTNRRSMSTYARLRLRCWRAWDTGWRPTPFRGSRD